MRNPIESTTGRHYKIGGTIQPLDFKAVGHDEAVMLLMKVKRQGIYRPYIPHVIEASGRLKANQHITFHVPVINGKDKIFTAKHLMSVINYGLMKSKIQHRLRYVQDQNLLISEPVEWKGGL